MEKGLQQYLKSKGFQQETLDLLTEEQLIQLAADYHFNGKAYGQ